MMPLSNGHIGDSKRIGASPSYMLAMAHALKGDNLKAGAAVADLREADPNFKLTELRKPQSSYPAAYKEWFEKKYLPAARKAGLPE